VLELVGTPAALEQSVKRLGAPLLRNSGPFLIGGFGEVGRKIRELLTDVGEEVRVIERGPGTNVDVVGDVLDASVLTRAGIAEARALLLALDSDDSTLFATVIVRDLVSDVPVIARVNHARNLENMHRAGADYALSISDISGQMLSARLLGGRGRVREEHRRVVSIAGSEHAGQPILAVERGGALVTSIDPTLRIASEDRLWVCVS
jgi:Trk K+ transport system NAD-binding subunit